VSKDQHYRSLLLPGSDSDQQEKQDAYERLLPLLPEPIPLDVFITDLRTRLSNFDRALLGEVGVDRIFRIPFTDDVAHDATGVARLSPFTVPIEHQLALLEAQFAVAVDLRRNISLHSVKAPQITVDLFERMAKQYGDKWKAINIDLHSCTFSQDVLKRLMVRLFILVHIFYSPLSQKAHRNVYCSLSTGINANGRSDNYVKLIEACPDDRLLVESDFPHLEQCEQRTWDMLVLVARVKGWRLETEWEEVVPENGPGAARIMANNWQSFMRLDTSQ